MKLGNSTPKNNFMNSVVSPDMYGSRKETIFSTTPEDGKGATTDPWQCTTVLMPHVALRTLPRVAQKAWESGHANKIMIKWTCQKLKVFRRKS